MEEIKLIAEENNIRVDTWIASKEKSLSRAYVQKLIEDGNILVNGKRVKSNYRIKTGDEAVISLPEPVVLDVLPQEIDLDILYEDSDIIVINKPKGMVVHPAAGNYSDTLVNALMAHCGESLSDINGVIRPGIVHRIDKDTSGVLVIAKNNTAHEKLSEKLKVHDITRIYRAVVQGVIREEKGRVDAPIGRHPVDRKKMAVDTRNGRRAVTHFKVLERFKDSTYIEVTLETGRTHQIRVHMSYIGYPLIGDEVYGRKNQKYGVKGQALHAMKLGFEHPATGRYVEFEAKLPEYFEKLLLKLREGF